MAFLKKIRKYKYGMAAAAIILFGFILHLNNLGIHPRWYSDEGSILNISWNLIHGQARYFEMKQTFVPHFPLFYLLGGFFILLFGKTIFAIRLLAIILVTASVSVSYFIGKEIKNKKVGLLIVFVLTIFPCFFITARYAFFSTLGLLELSLVILFSLKYINTGKEKWIYYLSVVLSLVFVSEIYLWGLAIVLPLLLWEKNKKLLLKALALIFVPLAVFFIIMLIFSGKNFLDDIQFYFFRRVFIPQKANSEPIQRLLAIFKLWFSFTSNYWGYIGPIGLFFIENKKIRSLFIFLFIVVLVPIFSFISMSFLLRNQILVVFLSLFGVIFLMLKVYPYIHKLFQPVGKIAYYCVIILLSLIVAKTILLYLADDLVFLGDTQTNAEEMTFASATANYLNSNSVSSDLVVTSNDIFSHLIKARVSNIYMTTAFDGLDNSVYMPQLINRDRYYSDLSLDKAKFLVYDNEMETFLKTDEPNIVIELQKAIEWPLVYQMGHYDIRLNPAFEK
jgi:4-amino-4-deoxy-L-arabinose transferase-like glycosyltransferase